MFALKESVELEPEKWAALPWSDEYEVSTLGKVRSLKSTPRILVGQRVGNYLKVSTSLKGLVRSHYVHRLVCETFLGASNLEVNHKDGDPHNNCLWNLEYVTRSQNELHKRGGKFGVSKFRNGYRARIWIERKEIHLGCFKTFEEAMLARTVAAKERGLYV